MSINIVAFGSFEPVRSKMVEFRLINKVNSSDGLVSITTAAGEMIQVHPDLINDEGGKTVKSKSTSKKKKRTKKLSRNCCLTVSVQPIKETRKEAEPASRQKAPAKPSKLMRKPITLEDFLLPLPEKEDELQISNCN